MLILKDLLIFAQDSGLDINSVLYAILVTIIAGPILALISIFVGYKRLSNEKKILNLNKQIADDNILNHKKTEINNMLTALYLPIRYYLIQSKMLYETFALEEKRELKAEGKRFNTLEYLCSGSELSSEDYSILDKILDIGKKQNKIIERNTWAINDDSLSELLSLYSTHLKTLLLARKENLSGMGKTVRKHRFPIELPGAVESNIFKLIDKKEQLIEAKAPKIGKRKQDTKISNFYNRIATQYFDKTINSDMSTEYENFIKEIKPGGLICDIGSGTGRDSQFFIKNGFRVLSTDISDSMVEYTNTYPFAYAKKESILDMHYPSKFDALWVCAVIQHIQPRELDKAIARLSTMLKPNGIIYISYRTSRSSKEIFLSLVKLHNKDRIINLFKNNNMHLIMGKTSISKKDKKNTFQSFIFKKGS